MTVPDGYSPLGPMGFDERALFGLTSAGGAIYTIADITQEKTAELSQTLKLGHSTVQRIIFY
jgi:hypothetical protein